MSICMYVNIFSSETIGPIKFKFNMEPPCNWGTTVCSTGPGHMTKMAPCPYMVQSLKSFLLRNQKAVDLETWYEALGARVLPSLFK